MDLYAEYLEARKREASGVPGGTRFTEVGFLLEKCHGMLEEIRDILFTATYRPPEDEEAQDAPEDEDGADPE